MTNKRNETLDQKIERLAAERDNALDAAHDHMGDGCGETEHQLKIVEARDEELALMREFKRAVGILVSQSDRYGKGMNVNSNAAHLLAAMYGVTSTEVYAACYQHAGLAFP